VRARIKIAETAANMEKRKEEYNAEDARILAPNDPNWLDSWARKPFDDDDPRVHQSLKATTRLGDPSIQVVCWEGIAEEAELSGPFDHAKINALNDCMISISKKGLFHLLLQQDSPVTWKKNGALRYAKLVVFKNGKARVGDYNLTLDNSLGLVITKEKESNGIQSD